MNVYASLNGNCFIGTSSEFFPIHSFNPLSSRQQSSLNNKDSKNKEVTSPESAKAADDSNAPSQSSDPPILTRFETILPSKYIPYARLARLDKPIGTMLLVRLYFAETPSNSLICYLQLQGRFWYQLWPCAWSIVLASSSLLVHAPAENFVPVISLLGSFGIGAMAMRGAGCTVNDLWDRKYDKYVSRTKDRPLISGSVTPKQAMMFVIFQSLIGLSVLISLQPHSLYCIYWGCLSLPLVAVYPTMKRFFWYPQLILGLTFNWGAILGWAAVHGSIDWSVVGPLYTSGVTWTLVYDTIYAHQDKKDDAKLQLHSTALSFGSNDDAQRLILHGLAAVTWMQWIWAGYNAMEHVALPFYSVGVTLAYIHLVWQIQTANFNDPHNLAERFRGNSTTGAIVFGAIATAVAAQAAMIV
jgi:4-hydroxybenzoate polyprenyltransferase